MIVKSFQKLNLGRESAIHGNPEESLSKGSTVKKEIFIDILYDDGLFEN